MKTVVLSRRNLLALLSKLDRVKAGEHSSCTIIKPCGTIVHAVEDDVAYANRPAGMMHPDDEAVITKPKTGTAVAIGY